MAWRVARSLDTLLGQFNAACPQRSKASDGSIGDAAHASRDSDHNPWYGPGIVTARDYTHDPANGMDIDEISDQLAASRDPRIKYIIANAMILDSRPGNSPWRWVPYRGANSHRHHCHVSVMPNASADDTRPWNLPMFHGVLPTPSAAAPAQAAGGYPLIRRGSRGDIVRTLQDWSNWYGWRPALPVVAEDGIFGERTDNLVRLMQAQLGVGVDGVVGPVTWGALARRGFPGK